MNLFRCSSQQPSDHTIKEDASYKGCPIFDYDIQASSNDENADPSSDCRTTACLVAHANTCLTLLDDRLSTQGGLFSLLPNEEYYNIDGAKNETKNSIHALANKTLLGQFFTYTRSLVRRVSELEFEIANAREVLAGEATVPAATALWDLAGPLGRPPPIRPMVWPQDRYILANLTDSLWQSLHAVLDTAEEEVSARQQRANHDGIRIATIITRKRLVPNLNHSQPANKVDDGNVPPEYPTASQLRLAGIIAMAIVPFRVYRLSSTPSTLFCVPLPPNDPAVADTLSLLEKPLVQTVAQPQLGRSETAWGRIMEEEVKKCQMKSRKWRIKYMGEKAEKEKLESEVKFLRSELERDVEANYAKKRKSSR